MAVLTFPSIIPATCTWGIVTNTQVTSSPISKSVQTQELPGARWKATLSFIDLPPSEARTLIPFLIQLRGRSGRFYLHDFSHPLPAQGTKAAEAVTISDAVTIASIADTSDLTIGDYVEVNDEVKIITAIPTSTTVTVEPPFRDQTAGTATFDNASCIMMLQDDEQVQWASRGKIYLNNITLNCIEAF